MPSPFFCVYCNNFRLHSHFANYKLQYGEDEKQKQKGTPF